MIDPRCGYFGTCGGCSWQDVGHAEQVERKRKALEEATGFREIMVFAGPEYGYRNRMDMVFTAEGIGFRRKGTWREAVDVDSCPISNERLNGLIGEVRGHFRKPDHFDLVRKTGTLRYAVIRATSLSSSVAFILNSGSGGKEEATERVREFASGTTADNVLVGFNPPNSDVSTSQETMMIKGDGVLREKMLGRVFSFPMQGFFQNNVAMAERMHARVREILGGYPTKGAGLMDLYGGVGTFGIINSDLFGSVKVVEGSEELAGFAKGNAEANGVSNLEAMALNDRKMAGLEAGSPLYAIADPPRAGMHPKARKWVSEKRPEALIYISCNPAQFSRDFRELRGFAVKSISMFDLFPQTPHMEAVVELVPRD